MAQGRRAGALLWILMVVALGGGYIAWKSASQFGPAAAPLQSSPDDR